MYVGLLRIIEIAAWRKALKLGDNHNILVAFTWCSDEDLRMTGMFPEYMACDTTFGVIKEHRNLFVVAGIDGHNKVFTTISCFVTSKETKAYHWVMRTALHHLVTDTTLSFN